MKTTVSSMTNRELYTEYEEGRKDSRHFDILTEMAKRINRHMITSDVVPIFKQYKLNGAGDQRF